MFPLCRGCGLFERVFPFNVHEISILDEQLVGHENPNHEEPLVDWIMHKMR